MLPSNPIETMDVYASQSQYIAGPSPAQQAKGTVPLDTLPADWWNWLWRQITERINQASDGMESIYDEVMSVLTAASIEPSQLQSDQLLNAIKALARVTGTAAVAGAVKSSADSGKVSIDENGIMTVNGLGVPTSLNTTAKNVVNAINEILLNYTNNKATTDASIEGLQNGKAPTNHASEETTYGAGTASTYGHVKLSDSYDTETPKSANESVGASQVSVAAAYAALKAMIEATGGLPTHLADNPMLNASAGESGTFTVSEGNVGFYYIEARGGDGGNGGNGGFSAFVGGIGGRGGSGQVKNTTLFLLAGEYKYNVGGPGGRGVDGGVISAQRGGGGGGGGGRGGTTAFYKEGSAPYIMAVGGNGGGGGGGGGTKTDQRGGGGGGGGATHVVSPGATGATGDGGPIGGPGGAAGPGYIGLFEFNYGPIIFKNYITGVTYSSAGGAGGDAGPGATGDGGYPDGAGTEAGGYLKIWKLV